MLEAIPGSNVTKRPLDFEVRTNLLESENVQIIDKVDKCPNIYAKIQGIKTDALIDTGSEITCISESFFENNKNTFKNCKIFPIVGTSVVGATGAKPIRLKHQLYADLSVNDETYSCIFIVIPNLNKNCILVIDASKLNEIMVNDYECAEPTEVLFQRCGGSKIMSTMDLTSSFWQIPLAEKSKKYTAFLHEGKCYEFCVTPFGLKTSTSQSPRFCPQRSREFLFDLY